MGVQRPLDSGEKDALGRPIKVSGAVAAMRASAPPPPTAIDIDDRLDKLAAGKYAAGLAIAAGKPWPRRDPGNWWETRKLLAEHNHHRGDYPMFPEAGLNQDVNLRTYRRCYDGNGTAIRMPSRAAINRHVGRRPGTFDLPVEVDGPYGPVTSTVRCTQVAPGVWHVTPTSRNPSTSEIAAAEAARAVLEAQRPTMALAKVRDLVERAERRTPVGGVRRLPTPSSSFIEAAGFGRRTPVVAVEMHGTTYAYNVPAANAVEFLAAVREGRSVGAAYNEHVKGHPRVEMRACRGCKVQVPVGAGLGPHVCEVHKKRSA